MMQHEEKGGFSSPSVNEGTEQPRDNHHLESNWGYTDMHEPYRELIASLYETQLLSRFHKETSMGKQQK